MKVWSLRRWLAALSGLACVLLGVWAFWLEPSGIATSRQFIDVVRWPKPCVGLKLAILADLHVGSPFNDIGHLRQIVALTNRERPDLILLPGDFVIQEVLGGTFVPPEEAAVQLAALRAPMGVYAVLGNHDHWLGAARVQHALSSAGIQVLEDRGIAIRRGQCVLSLVGVSDFVEGRHDVVGALRFAPENAAVLLFTHNPDVFPDVPERVLLTIAGHTHGGQVYIPGIGRPIVPSRYGQRYAIGHIRERGRDLFVSSGLGTSILPVRFLVPPEVTVLTIDGAGL